MTSPPDEGPGWGRVGCVVVARLLLVTTLSLVVWSVVPALAGWTPRVIMSGSMEPRIAPGDIVVTRPVPAASLVKGQVVAVDDPDHPGRTRTHRFVRRDPAGRLVLRGDANAQADSSHVAPSHVLGLAVLRVPVVGRPLVWVAERRWVPLGATALAGAWCLATVRPRRRPLWPARAVVVASAAAVAVATVAGPADAAFSSTTVAPASNLAAGSTFYPYRTAVLADNPYLFWRLSETSGATAAADASPNGRAGTIYTSPTFAQSGPITSEVKDTAIATSTSTIAYRTAATAPAAFSLEAWVRTTSTSGGAVLGYGSSSNGTTSATTDRELYLAPGGKAVFGVGALRTAISSTAVVNDGTWHQLVATYTTGTGGMKLYVDGALSATGTGTTATSTGYWRAAAESLSLWPSHPTGSSYDGRLDEVAVYPSALSAARVQAHYLAATS